MCLGDGRGFFFSGPWGWKDKKRASSRFVQYELLGGNGLCWFLAWIERITAIWGFRHLFFFVHVCLFPATRFFLSFFFFLLCLFVLFLRIDLSARERVGEVARWRGGEGNERCG
jgi:hypothetical protein